MHLLSILVSLTLLAVCSAHGVCVTPNQRGTQQVWDFNPFAKNVDPDAEIDFKPHFPAGNKANVPGAGKQSQRAASMPEGWTLFEPLKKGFKWRAGVCGDPINGEQEHMKGGKYYDDGIIVAEYKQGGIMKVELNIVAHHNGYIEFHVCDVKKCPNEEISPKCFTDGHCYPLERAYNPKCDERKSNNCGPIDRNYKGRWYLPCSPTYPAKGFDFYGQDDTILYKLPDDLACEHCVLHWFWTAANDCNPTGVREYFEGPDAPNWPNCGGEGGAVAGFAKNQGPCGGSKNPEEYYQCADIRITPREMRKLPTSPNPSPSPVAPSPDPVPSPDPLPSADPSPSPTKTPMPSPEATKTPKPKKTPKPSKTPAASYIPEVSETPEESPEESLEVSVSPELSPEPSEEPTESPEVGDKGYDKTIRDGIIRDLVLVADGKAVQSIYDGQTIDVSKFDKLAIECVTDRKVNKVEFFIDDKLVWTDYIRPYFMFGNKGNKPMYWKNPILNREFKLVTKTEGDEDMVRIKLLA